MGDELDAWLTQRNITGQQPAPDLRYTKAEVEAAARSTFFYALSSLHDAEIYADDLLARLDAAHTGTQEGE